MDFKTERRISSSFPDELGLLQLTHFPFVTHTAKKIQNQSTYPFEFFTPLLLTNDH